MFRGFRLRLPPHFRVFPSGWRGQTMGMRGSGDRIEQIYFQHQIFDFFFIFFGSYMYENFGNFLLIIFTISKIDFTIKKPILGRKRESMTSETTRLSMASETAWLSMASETAWLRAAPFNVISSRSIITKELWPCGFDGPLSQLMRNLSSLRKSLPKATFTLLRSFFKDIRKPGKTRSVKYFSYFAKNIHGFFL